MYCSYKECDKGWDEVLGADIGDCQVFVYTCAEHKGETQSAADEIRTLPAQCGYLDCVAQAASQFSYYCAGVKTLVYVCAEHQDAGAYVIGKVPYVPEPETYPAMKVWSGGGCGLNKEQVQALMAKRDELRAVLAKPKPSATLRAMLESLERDQQLRYEAERRRWVDQ